jgi:hypothetical protein
MKVSLDEKDYEVSEQTIDAVLQYVRGHVEEVYNKVPVVVTTMVETFARKKLYEMEREAYKDGMSKEQAALTFRPGEKQTPALKLMDMLFFGIKEIAKDVQAKFGTNNNGSITHLSYQYKDKSETWG